MHIKLLCQLILHFGLLLLVMGLGAFAQFKNKILKITYEDDMDQTIVKIHMTKV